MPKNRYDALLDFVCIKHGFCGCVKNGKRLHVNHFTPSSGPVTAAQFAEWVLLADDVNPNDPSPRVQKWKRTVRDGFVEQMGAEIVEAGELTWNHDEQ